MYQGIDLKEAFDSLIYEMGQTVIVHSRWNSPGATTHEVLGYMETKRENSNSAVFCFPEHIDIQDGAVLQLKSGRGLWLVVSTQDYIVDNVFVNYQAYVVKADS